MYHPPFLLFLFFLSITAPNLILSIKASITPKNIITAINTTKPGCQRKCGTLTIPYPFGIGPNCSLNRSFNIKCNTSFNPPKPFSETNFGTLGNPEILDITETHLVIRNFKTLIASKCYNATGTKTSAYVAVLNMGDFPFTYSSSANKLTVIGCDDFAEIHTVGTTSKNGKQDNITTGCLAMCASTITTPNEKMLPGGACSGSLCCRTSIPVGVRSFQIILSPLVRSLYYTRHCGFAFIAGNDSFLSFRGVTGSTPNTTVVSRIIEKAPIVLDWAVGVPIYSTEPKLTCSKAKKNLTAYVCQSNSECVDSEAGGYRCNCLNGYEGNPYLKPGCTDINECAAGRNNPCSMACLNTPGSYKCSCPRGYSGDGLKSGIGCVKTPSTTLKKITFGLGVSLGTIVLMFAGWLFSSFIKKRRLIKQKAKNFERNGGLILKKQMATDESVVARMKIFTVDELDRATDHFNEDRILGQGGQGTVYKGMLSEGKLVAIKKSQVISENQLGNFINEVVILSQINHRNIVKLLGCCLETEVPLLVYEFVMNGTLFNHIHNPSEEFPITWKMRLQIASDAAAALAYLHSSSSIPILHRDIKSSNILLDDKYRGKLSDFGTSRSINVNQTHVTTRVMGTFGYLDPGYFHSNVLTEKSDVYSFGVVLVELLTGQKAIITISEEEEKSLSSWFLSHMENSRLLDIIDPQVLQEDISYEEFHTIAKLAERCLYLDGKRRPTMKEVLIEIEEVISVHIPEKNRKNCAETEQVCGEITDHSLHDTPLGSRTTNSLCSAEMSLMLNPR